MSDTSFLDRAQEMEAEHSAWQAALTELADVLGASSSQIFNEPRFDAGIDKIRLWGERLVALRVQQTPEERQKALDYAVGLVENGR